MVRRASTAAAWFPLFKKKKDCCPDSSWLKSFYSALCVCEQVLCIYGSRGEVVYTSVINTKCVSITGSLSPEDKCNDIKLQCLTTISKKTLTLFSDIISSYQNKFWWQISVDIISMCKAAKQLISHWLIIQDLGLMGVSWKWKCEKSVILYYYGYHFLSLFY